MTAPAWATNLTDFYLDGATTVAAVGTPAALSNPETDYFIQGSSCISKGAWTNATKGFVIDALGTTFTVPTDGAVILYAKFDAQGSLDTKANGGFQVVIGSGSSAFYHYYVGGKTTLAFSSWESFTVDPNTATLDNTTGSPDGTERWVGVLANLPTTSGPSKGNPIAADAIRYGRCDLEYTYGDGSPDYNTFELAEATANSNSNRWGLIQYVNGIYLIQGFHSFGTGDDPVDFRDSNKVVFIRASGNNNLTGDSVSTAFNRIEILNSGSNVDWDNIIFQALGTRARGVFVHTAGTFDATSCQFVDMDTFSLLSTSVMTDCIFRRTNAITAPGSTLNGSKILAPTVAADASALVWDSATAPSGKLDDMEFSKGTNAHHAIEFGTSSPTTMTLNNITFTGFNATPGSNDSALYFGRTIGTVTVSLSGCTGTITAKSAGATIDLVIDPVDVTITATEIDGDPIYQAQVFLKTSSAAGDFPFQESVTIANSGTTATVTHATHGLATNDYVFIEGASLNANNGVFQITVNDAGEYEYTMGSTPGSSPTGSITSTFVLLFGLTDIDGEITMSKTFTADQPVTGFVRKYSGTPKYKTAPVIGLVDKDLGKSFTAVLVED
jgi:hypothetical protein